MDSYTASSRTLIPPALGTTPEYSHGAKEPQRSSMTDASSHEHLHAALAETARAHGPGVFALVTDGDEVVFEATAGVADVGSGRPIDDGDRFRIGSVTKTYVAALALDLVAEPAFALDDTIERWLPGLVPGGDGISVEMLLRMRSGLP